MNISTHHNKDLDITVVATAHSHYVEYAVHQIAWWDGDDESIPMYTNDTTHNFSKEVQDVYIKGSVKWDGCSNWNLDEHNSLHACSRQDLINVGNILAYCWDLTAELCEAFDN